MKQALICQYTPSEFAKMIAEHLIELFNIQSCITDNELVIMMFDNSNNMLVNVRTFEIGNFKKK